MKSEVEVVASAVISDDIISTRFYLISQYLLLVTKFLLEIFRIFIINRNTIFVIYPNSHRTLLASQNPLTLVSRHTTYSKSTLLCTNKSVAPETEVTDRNTCKTSFYNPQRFLVNYSGMLGVLLLRRKAK